MTALIQLDGVGLTVTQPVPVRILHPTTLELNAGETVAVVGPSGAGKTTLASIIGALQPCSEGSYIFDGLPLSNQSPAQLARFRREEVGFVFQQANLIDERPAWRNVALGINGFQPATAVRDQARGALESVGLEGVADRRAALLSGGERQRVAIARAIVKSPRLLLADEPTGALDQRTGADVLDLLFGYSDPKRIVLLVTHDLRVVDRADRVLTITDGRLT